MTVLTVQIGQCGNQLGFEFFDIIYKHICSSKNENFKNKLIDMYFDEECKYDGNIFPIIDYEENKCKKNYINENNINCLNNYIAKCILIDMEPKVIEKCLHLNSPKNRLADNYEKKKKKNDHKNYEHEIKNFNDETHQKYICGFEEYYEPGNNFLKVFNDKEKKLRNGQDTWNHEKIYDNGYFEENTKNNNTNAANGYFTNEWKYNNNNFVYGLNGSGNNWSYGFNVHAKNICDHFLNLVNRELEKNESRENIDNILLFHSLAGGSGSGISSYISYILKDEFPKINLINTCVLPYMFGEISVQSLNSTLCLSSLYDVSDCLILFENDKFELMCKRINNENINTDEINRYISLFLAYNIGLPIDYTNLKSSSNHKYSNFMNSILTDLCCHPNYKLLSTRYLPQVFKENMKFENNSFNMLLKRMHKMVIKGSILDSDVMNTKGPITECSNLDNYFAHLSSRDIRQNKIFSKHINIPIYLNESISNSYVNYETNSIFLKKNQKNYSTKKQTYNHHIKNVTENIPSNNFIHNNVIFNSKMIMRGEINENINLDLFKNHVLYNNKSLNPLDVYIDESKQFNYNSISMISNCLTPIPTLKKVLHNAKMLYSTNAYIYQYNNYGVTHDQVHNSLMSLEQIINSYENLSCG